MEPAASYLAGLIAALDHPEPSTPVRAATLLGELEAREAVEPLRSVLRSQADPYLLEAAATALGALGDRAAVPELIATLERGPVIARRAAVGALRRLGGDEAAAALARAARADPTASVRAAAAEAVEALRGKR